MMVTTDDNGSASGSAGKPRSQTGRREISSGFRLSASTPAVKSVKTAFAGKGSLGLHRRDDSQRAVKRDVREEEFQDF
jgi:hypothetical protein